jgi:hypothetical protein
VWYLEAMRAVVFFAQAAANGLGTGLAAAAV